MPFVSASCTNYFTRAACFALGTFVVAAFVECLSDTGFQKMMYLMDCEYPQALATGEPTWNIIAKATTVISIARVGEAIKLMPPVFAAYFIFEGRGRFSIGKGYYGPLRTLKPLVYAFFPFLIDQLCFGVWDIIRRIYMLKKSKTLLLLATLTFQLLVFKFLAVY